MRLFEIADQVEYILANEVDRETGELTDATTAALDDSGTIVFEEAA